VLVGGLTRDEARAAVRDLEPAAGGATLTPVWGNLFVRAELAELSPGELARPVPRGKVLHDDLAELSEEIYRSSHIVQLILGTSQQAPGARPDIVVDAVNTATALAYGGVYPTLARGLALRSAGEAAVPEDLDALLSAHTIPKLVRHMQLLAQALTEAGTTAYVKVGTTGTGGMGLNIPYTHGEEKPSRVLLTKTALAGAHSMLLFALARTPGAPIVTEVKPAATITWKRIAYGPVRRRGEPIMMYDCAPDAALTLVDGRGFQLEGSGRPLDRPLESVFIDTGENGLFSVGEYTAITALGQMEAVTPEEIARVVVRQLEGRPTGRDVIAALDGAVMGPGYRAGALRSSAIAEARALAEQHGTSSVAFEILGPPRLSKLLFEAELSRRAFGGLEELARAAPVVVTERWADRIGGADADLRQSAVSVGLPILMPDGRRLLCAARDQATTSWEAGSWEVSAERIEHWSEREWIDLRATNAARWIERARLMAEESARDEDSADRSSTLDRRFASGFDIGEVAAWIFEREDGGFRA
jgi:hypothetical protein